MEQAEFAQTSLLGRCLTRPEHNTYETAIRYGNREPLAITFNAAIESSSPGTVLVFCSDDLDLGPDNLGPQLQDALARFDVVGVCGNQRHQSGQIAWWLDPTSSQSDHPYLSGAIRRGSPGSATTTVFGPSPMPVQLLDGIFLAVRADDLQRSGVRFDPGFAFHHADLDFCRSANQAGLSLGTWPLPLLRANDETAKGEICAHSAQLYQRKWGALSPPAKTLDTPQNQLQEVFRSARKLEKAQAWPEAEQLYRQLLQLKPNHGPAQLQLANVLHRQRRPNDAIGRLDALLQSTDSTYSHGVRARAHTNRGAMRHLQGHLDAAAADHSEALRLEPELTIAGENMLAVAMDWRSLGFTHQALEALRVILRATPQRPDLLLELGNILMELGRVEAAVPCFRRLLRQTPQLAEGHYQLGEALAALGQTEAAIQALATAQKLNPEATNVLISLEWHRLSLCDWEDYDRRAALLLNQLQRYVESRDGPLVAPLRASVFELPPLLHRHLGERWSEPTRAGMAGQRLPPAPPRTSRQRLLIGYLSADFRDHAMGHLIHGLFPQHDRRRFEVFAYSLSDVSDPINAAIRNGVDHFVMVADHSSEAIAQRIRADGIDVLIDLMGHTHHGRPSVLARRPAALQLHYLGYPSSLGADWIDGVIADSWLIPPDHESHYGEAVHRLPWGFVSSRPVEEATDPLTPPLSRQALDLPEHGVVFACFHRPEKITPRRFDSWLEILRQVPKSCLWIINDHHLVEERLRARATAAGLESQRLVFSPMLESAVFAQACSLADLLLDTSPYSSGATAVTALAAGLPLLTCPGDNFASRMGASLCAATGLNELICSTPEAYQHKAIELGQQPNELQRMRHHLLDHHHNLPLFNTAAWVKNFENLLEQLFA